MAWQQRDGLLLLLHLMPADFSLAFSGERAGDAEFSGSHFLLTGLQRKAEHLQIFHRIPVVL